MIYTIICKLASITLITCAIMMTRTKTVMLMMIITKILTAAMTMTMTFFCILAASSRHLLPKMCQRKQRGRDSFLITIIIIAIIFIINSIIILRSKRHCERNKQQDGNRD